MYVMVMVSDPFAGRRKLFVDQRLTCTYPHVLLLLTIICYHSILFLMTIVTSIVTMAPWCERCATLNHTRQTLTDDRHRPLTTQPLPTSGHSKVVLFLVHQLANATNVMDIFGHLLLLLWYSFSH
jgi:hypothetical protein